MHTIDSINIIMSSRAAVAAEAATAAAIHSAANRQNQMQPTQRIFTHRVHTVYGTNIRIWLIWDRVCLQCDRKRDSKPKVNEMVRAMRARIPKFNPLSSLPSSCVRHNFSLLFFYVCYFDFNFKRTSKMWICEHTAQWLSSMYIVSVWCYDEAIAREYSEKLK